MCTVLLPPDVNPIAVDIYIIYDVLRKIERNKIQLQIVVYAKENYFLI